MSKRCSLFSNILGSIWTWVLRF